MPSWYPMKRHVLAIWNCTLPMVELLATARIPVFHFLQLRLCGSQDPSERGVETIAPNRIVVQFGIWMWSLYWEYTLGSQIRNIYVHEETVQQGQS